MSRLQRLLLVSFLESVAILLVQRGVFFFARERLGFSDVDNLWLGAAAGAVYVVSALMGHRLSQRLGERNLLLGTLLVQMAAVIAMAALPGHAWVVCGGTVAMFCVNALKWAVIESYLTAGQTPLATARLVGQFNVAWSIAVPVGVAASGPLISFAGSALFLAGMPLTVISILLVLPLEARCAHLPEDHPHRPLEQIERCRSLLTSTRWTLLQSYTLVFMLAPLLPMIFQTRLGFSVQTATIVASLMDLSRSFAFWVMQRSTFWNGRVSVPLVCIVLLPATFFLVLLGPNVAVVVIGELIFGFLMGVVYHMALYYAMVVSNGSVDGGGGHESMVGAGFALGPLSGLLGKGLAGVTGPTLGLVGGIAPALVICSAGALRPLLRLAQTPTRPAPADVVARTGAP